jgi:hypothetical protein
LPELCREKGLSAGTKKICGIDSTPGPKKTYGTPDYSCTGYVAPETEQDAYCKRHHNGESNYQSGTSGTASSVVGQAYETARRMGVGPNDKLMLSLFETCLVESNCHNLDYGDRDSLGFLQQRPSQGWGTAAQVRNVPYATRKFISKAKQVDRQSYSAGELAQAVQDSAYPSRYDKREADARAIIAKLS